MLNRYVVHLKLMYVSYTSIKRKKIQLSTEKELRVIHNHGIHKWLV